MPLRLKLLMGKDIIGVDVAVLFYIAHFQTHEVELQH
jgi:hypothetical protein